MKTTHLVLPISFILLFFQCKDSEPEVVMTTLCGDDAITTLTLDYGDGITLEFPECFSVMYLAGIDSFVGKVEAPDEGIEIFFDIGDLAGEYVDSDTPDMTTVQGDFEVFRYAVRNGNELRFTFPSAGPTNFYTRQIEHQDDLVEFFKTLKFN